MKYLARSLVILTFVFLIAPSIVMGAASCPATEIIPCGCDKDTSGIVEPAEACEFTDLIILAQNVIEFLIFKIAAPLGAIMFAYAGFLYVTNAGNEGQIKRAHDIFWGVFLGLVVCLAAWLVVWFIVNFFLDSTYVFLAPPS